MDLVDRRAVIMGEAIRQARLDALNEAAAIADGIAIRNMGLRRNQDRVLTAQVIRDQIRALIEVDDDARPSS